MFVNESQVLGKDSFDKKPARCKSFKRSTYKDKVTKI